MTAIPGQSDASTAVSQGKSKALSLNYMRDMVVCQKIIDVEDGVTELDPLYLAAVMTGLSAGTSPVTPITRKPVRCAGIPSDQVLTPSQRDDALKNGVTVIGANEDNVIWVIMAVSTALSEKRMERMWSEVNAADYMEYNINELLRTHLGKWATNTMKTSAQGAVNAMLTTFKEQGIISDGVHPVTKTPQPAFLPPVVTISSGLMSVSWDVWIGGEVDHIGVSGRVGYVTLTTEVAL